MDEVRAVCAAPGHRLRSHPNDELNVQVARPKRPAEGSGGTEPEASRGPPALPHGPPPRGEPGPYEAYYAAQAAHYGPPVTYVTYATAPAPGYHAGALPPGYAMYGALPPGYEGSAVVGMPVGYAAQGAFPMMPAGVPGDAPPDPAEGAAAYGPDVRQRQDRAYRPY
jgi:hypothetical protein